MSFLRCLIVPALFLAPLWGGSGGIALAQRGKQGTPAPITSTITVNEYTALTADAGAGATTLTVTANTLNANGRFPGNLAPGDLLMIIQMQGATIDGTPNGNLGIPSDSSWGAIKNYNNSGNWEFAQVNGVSGSTNITVDCPLTYSYTAAGKTQVVRIPRYNSLTINSGGTITCDPWNATIGGICAIEVENNTTINTGGSINTSGNGFRGGVLYPSMVNWGVPSLSASILPEDGGEKGEGIAGYQSDYNLFGGRYCKASPANGGGGGNAQNAGGGGGANGGNIAAWNGVGIPAPGYVSAWNLEYPGLATLTSSGGGKGGYTFSSNSNDPTTNGPNNFAIWGGDWRRSCGGFGGRPLDYSSGRLFLAGGGGAGNQNDNSGGAGANGGGLIYLMNYGTVSGAGQIVSNGNAGSNTKNADQDGAGGGGAGGTIIVNSVGAISGVSITANGGKGGDQAFSFPTVQAEGPGGGGGGGYIAVSNGTPAKTTNGGVNGTTNSTGVTPKFPPNGATGGGAGTNNAAVTNFIINAANTTLCAGQSSTLNAALTGNPPAGTTIVWYDAIVAGNVIANGITPVLAAGTYTYYAGTCPGTYRQPVQVTVTNAALISVTPNTTICAGGNTTLSAAGGTGYSWSPATGLSNPNISNPVATPTTTTLYVATVATSCGTSTASVAITVNPSIPPTVTGNTTLCAGGNTTLTASGGNNYLWSTNETTASIVVTPTATTIYSVTAGGACSGINTVTVNVMPDNIPFITGNTTLCAGGNTTLTVSGGNNYLWSTNETTTSITVAPTTTTIYSVTTVGACPEINTVTVNVMPDNIPLITGNTTLCAGGNTTLTASGSGDNNYLWSTNETTASIVVTPIAMAVYSVTTVGACPEINTVTVNVTPDNIPLITGNTSLCAGGNTTLTASGSGGNNYLWSTNETTGSIVVMPTTTTVYSVTAGGACPGTNTVTVNVVSNTPPLIIGNLTICAGGNTTLTASGGNSYLWSTNETTSSIIVSPTATTIYSVTSGACAGAASVTVSVASSITPTISGNTTICAGIASTLTASGGTSYVWSTGASTATIPISPMPSSSTTYTVVAMSGSCTGTATITVNTLPKLYTYPSGNNIICLGATSTLIAIVSDPTNNTYLWSTGATTSSIQVTPTVTTTYTVTGYSGTCYDSEPIVVIVMPQATATVSPNTTICSGQSTVLTASGGSSYVWSTGAVTSAITVSPLVNSTYSVIAGIGTCTDKGFISVSVLPSPTVTISKNITVCGGDQVTLNASGGTTYAWNNGAVSSTIIVSPATTTSYSVIATSGMCKDTGKVTVTVSPPPVAAIHGNSYICQGFSATLTATGGGMYLWSPGNQTVATINPTATGTYSVTVSVGSCKNTAAVTTAVVPNPIASVSPDVFILQGQSANLVASGGDSYLWDDGSTGADITVSPLATTVYCVTVYDLHACYDTSCVTVNIELCDNAGALYLPNAFSPNSDGENDELQIYYKYLGCIEKFYLVLYNRWGEKIYETNDRAFKWNGVYNSGFLKNTTQGGTEVYTYYMNATLVDGTKISKKGNISLIR